MQWFEPPFFTDQSTSAQRTRKSTFYLKVFILSRHFTIGEKEAEFPKEYEMKNQKENLIALLICVLMTAGSSWAQAATVKHPVRFAVSEPMFEAPESVPLNTEEEHEVLSINRKLGSGIPGAPDPALQTEAGPALNGTPGIDFEGLGVNGSEPSDVNLAVGPNHIVQTVNTEWAVYDKTGHIFSGFPKSLGSIWTNLGGACAQEGGDPIVQYDRVADRWLLSQLGSFNAPFSLCIAVSKSHDPTGTYSLYEYSFGNNFPDYPKYSVWPTASNPAYLQMAHLFQNFQNFIGTAACAYDRTAMLAGKANPVQICFTISNDGGFLPSDLDGSTPPPDASPGYFITFETSSLHEFQLTPNFANPNNSTFTGPINIPVNSFSTLCGGGTCVPQSGTTEKLDSLADRMMYRLAYRNFGDHESLVINHSVASGTSGGPRWYEIRSPGNSPTIFQQGTYAPDSNYRWMGSIAMGKAGDMLLSYSVSSGSMHPAIAYTGRLSSDTKGQMESENTLLTGTGSQTGHSRWGDYTAMRIDPSDDCTFWFTNQYLQTTGDFAWKTHVGSFVFTGCGGGTPGASLSTTKLNFGKDPLGQTSKAKSVTLTNNGTATLNLTSITISGNFAISANSCGSSLAVGAKCKVSVTFTPTGTGTRTGTLSFNDDAPGSPQTVALTGIGTSLGLSPTSWNFGSVTVGQTSSAKTFTLTNETGSSVGSIVVSLAGTNPSDYQITKNACGSTLAAHTSCNITVVFKPKVKGSLPATLKVSSNGVGSPQTAALKGTGV